MIEGDGFFQVTLPSGEQRYSRDGSFKLDANGALVTSSGYKISPSITIPTDARSISIGEDGTVSAFIGATSTAGTDSEPDG